MQGIIYNGRTSRATACVAASQLPPEILTRIFSLVPQGGYDDYDEDGLAPVFGPFGLRPVTDLLPLLLVCRYWRDVAFGDASLWSTLEIYEGRSLPVVVKHRSAEGPLDVHIYERATENTLEELKRVGHLVREFRAHDIGTLALPSYVDFAGDELRACKLSIRYQRGHPRLDPYISLFKGFTPRLRSLYFQGIGIFLPSNQFPSLTHLLLQGEVYCPPAIFKFSDFLTFLAGCPALETLHCAFLDQARMQQLPGPTRTLHPVSLKRLRKLSVVEWSINHTNRFWEDLYRGADFRLSLLSHLVVPDRCLICVKTILPREFADTVKHFPESFSYARPFPCLHMSARKLVGGYAEAANGNGVDEECLSFQFVDPDYGHPRGIRVDVQNPGERWFTRNPGEGRWAIYKAMSNAPLFIGVQKLWVSHAGLITLQDSVLSQLPHIVTLVIDASSEGSEDVDHLTALGVPDEDEDRFEYEDWAEDVEIDAPNLSTLCVHLSTEEQLEAVLRVVKYRKDLGRPLRRLVIRSGEEASDEFVVNTKGLADLVEECILLTHEEDIPDDLRWERMVPPECREASEAHTFWPAWY
ncbi:hypothetical protein L227DRAFT_198428 [Lentinus tigrinus ALCF2SS1-6]|uniref:F-box domain-containing protein n=1 Tax=Lentinus tigrinus ALCF2SS1-6 TaxID=1328759 RepID=A0A5C2SA22_9APHY|nr:hypothetical protein L227DRAFT_198428 [Lentinus tigrinus ALCF2SS1-6]